MEDQWLENFLKKQKLKYFGLLKKSKGSYWRERYMQMQGKEKAEEQECSGNLRMGQSKGATQIILMTINGVKKVAILLEP